MEQQSISIEYRKSSGGIVWHIWQRERQETFCSSTPHSRTGYNKSRARWRYKTQETPNKDLCRKCHNLYLLATGAGVKRVDLSNIKMTTGGEKQIGKIIDNDHIKSWVGIGWMEEGQATPNDYALYPIVID